MQVYLVYTEHYYGSSDTIQAFKTQSAAEQYRDELTKELDDEVDVLANSFDCECDIDGDVVYVTATEEWYGDLQVHSTLEQAEGRVPTEGRDIIVIKLVIQ